MRSRPTRTLSVGTTPTNIRKTAAFANDPDAYPVTFSVLRYPSGGGTVSLFSESQGLGADAATGELEAVSLPIAAETIVVNGVPFTFIAGASTATDVQIKASKELTMVEFAAVLNASVNASISVATYSVVGAVLTVTYDTTGPSGNAFTLADSSGTVAITRSAATLTGGTPLFADGQAVDAGVDFVDADQSVNRYAMASAGTISVTVTDMEA